MNKNINTEYITEDQLQARGWTLSMIKKYLPVPSEEHTLPGSSQRTWPLPTILKVERQPMFADEFLYQNGIKENNFGKKTGRPDKRLTGIILDRVPAQPRDEYPLARSIKRKFILHVGPTNSGKTYDSLERLKDAGSGVYLGPLRLLALEVFEKLNTAGVPCTLLTGEEKIDIYGYHTASTVEMLDTERHYDVVVIDEAQMLSDRSRGSSWTRAILGAYADEIHVCMAPQAESIVIKMIEDCGDSYSVVRHERKTPLVFDDSRITMKDIKPGDALILFSRRDVLALSSELEKTGIKASVLYGNLPPALRKIQVKKFMDGETSVVVSTDCLGMGINLAIRRIVFVKIEKFDGTRTRRLNADEIKQIAGRAGRYGMHEQGYVASIQEPEYVKGKLNEKIPEIQKILLPFPETLLDVKWDLPSILNAWYAIKTPAFYVRENPETMLKLYGELTELFRTQIKFMDKTLVYRFINCPLDEKCPPLMGYWRRCCRLIADGENLEMAEPEGDELINLEDAYKMLDLYFRLSRNFSLNFDENLVIKEKKKLEDKMDIMLAEKKDMRRKCRLCGKALPVTSSYGICEDCYAWRY